MLFAAVWWQLFLRASSFGHPQTGQILSTGNRSNPWPDSATARWLGWVWAVPRRQGALCRVGGQSFFDLARPMCLLRLADARFLLSTWSGRSTLDVRLDGLPWFSSAFALLFWSNGRFAHTFGWGLSWFDGGFCSGRGAALWKRLLKERFLCFLLLSIGSTLISHQSLLISLSLVRFLHNTRLTPILTPQFHSPRPKVSP